MLIVIVVVGVEAGALLAVSLGHPAVASRARAVTFVLACVDD